MSLGINGKAVSLLDLPLPQQRPPNKRQSWKAWYEDYLQSPGWAELRRKVLAREKGICQGCTVEKATEVHHTTYSHVGNELLFELLALCSNCHAKVHGRTRADL
jgi:5-methylcytosine-specific restriction endonuclease McrA